MDNTLQTKEVYLPIDVNWRLPTDTTIVPILMNKETYSAENGARSWGDKEFVSFPRTPMSAYYSNGSWYWECGEYLHLSEGEKITHWLEKHNLYCFTKEELTDIISNAFNSGKDSFAYEIGDEFEPDEVVYKNKSEYISTLLK